MKNIITIARMELQKLFYSPIAWLVLVIFGIQVGLEIVSIFYKQVQLIELGVHRSGLTDMLYAGRKGFFIRIQGWLFIYLPLITMGLISKEYSSGSIKLLYSSPISNTQIVLGKYLAGVVFAACMAGLLLIAGSFGLIAIENVDFAQILTVVLGLFLVMITYVAIGLFISALTSYQIVAAIGSIFTLFVLQQTGSLWQDLEFVRNITFWLSIGGRANTFVHGLICSEDFLYFLLVSALFLFFTVLRLKGIREKSNRLISTGRYLLAFLSIALIGYASTIPFLMKYYDATATKSNTLTKNSQEVISKLEGKVTITVYANVFDANFFSVSPKNQVRDAKRTWARYTRFFPNIDLKYKYYYAIPVEEANQKRFNRLYSGMNMKQALEKASNIYDTDPKLFKPADFYKNEIDLKAELNRCVRTIETADGKKTILHWYNDMMRVPSESQKTAAFKSLVDVLPVVGFVEGHLERNIDDEGERGFLAVAKLKTFRYALRNNGIDFQTVDLKRAVKSNIDILVIAEPKVKYNQQEMKNLNDFINRGGNLVIAADRNRQKVMNSIVERFGVTFEQGQVVEYNKGNSMDLITAKFTKAGMNLSYPFKESIAAAGKCVTMPGALALKYQPKEDFTYIPVLQSDSIKNLPNPADIDKIKEDYLDKNDELSDKEKRMLALLRDKEKKKKESIKYIGSWNELQITNFVDEIPLYNPEEGELGGPITTALALTRKVGDKQQRIMILGDADCISNGEITRNRAYVKADNFSFVQGLFFWLTNDQAPIDMRRPHKKDRALTIVKDEIGPYKIFYQYILPALLLACLLLIWLRRRGR